MWWEVALLRIIVATLLFATPAFSQTLYQSQNSAERACPNDTIVWLNTRSDVYHFQGERWYNNTEEGAFVCEKDADNNGDRATKNGE
jgi:hypothetical protein